MSLPPAAGPGGAWGRRARERAAGAPRRGEGTAGLFGVGLGSFGLGPVGLGWLCCVFFPRGGRRSPRAGAVGRGRRSPRDRNAAGKREKAGFVFYFFFFFSPFSLSLYARRCLHAVRREEIDIYVWLDGVWPSIISEHQRQDYVPGYEWIYSL